MEQVNSTLSTEIFIEDSIKMEDLMELEAINGKHRVPFMKEILGMGYVMEKENGKKAKPNIMVGIVKD
jgi:hypothetical protein